MSVPEMTGLDHRRRAGLRDHLYSKSQIEVCGGQCEEDRQNLDSLYVDPASDAAGGFNGSWGCQEPAWDNGQREGRLPQVEARFMGACQDAAGAHRFRASF